MNSKKTDEKETIQYKALCRGICYRFYQLDKIYHYLKSELITKYFLHPAIHEALLEAFLIHSRNLLEFFSDTKIGVDENKVYTLPTNYIDLFEHLGMKNRKKDIQDERKKMFGENNKIEVKYSNSPKNKKEIGLNELKKHLNSQLAHVGIWKINSEMKKMNIIDKKISWPEDEIYTGIKKVFRLWFNIIDINFPEYLLDPKGKCGAVRNIIKQH